MTPDELQAIIKRARDEIIRLQAALDERDAVIREFAGWESEPKVQGLAKALLNLPARARALLDLVGTIEEAVSVLGKATIETADEEGTKAWNILKDALARWKGEPDA